MITADLGLAMLSSGVVLLAAGEIGKRRGVRAIGLGALLFGCALTIIDLLAGEILTAA